MLSFIQLGPIKPFNMPLYSLIRRFTLVVPQLLPVHELPIHIVRIHTETVRTGSDKRFDLSQEQREELILGLWRGYFDAPSRVGLNELADERDISRQAVSNRIRRGTKQVLRETIINGIYYRRMTLIAYIECRPEH